MIRLRGYEVDDIGVEVTRPRRFERSLGRPYSARERPVQTDIPEVLEIERPPIPVKEIEDALESVRGPIEEGHSARLLNLIEGPIRALLDAEPNDSRSEDETEPVSG